MDSTSLKSHGFDFRRVRALASVLRTWLELGLGISILVWSLLQLPLAVRVLAEVLRRVVVFVSNPLFVFLFGNAIVVAIIAKSRGGGCGEESVCEENLGKSADTAQIAKLADPSTATSSVNTEANVRDDEQNVILPLAASDDDGGATPASDVLLDAVSEMLTKAEEKHDHCPQDELSDAEFQRAVDEFIARHLKLRRDESRAIVVNPNPQLVEPV